MEVIKDPPSLRPLLTNDSSLQYEISYRLKAVKRPVETVFVQNINIELNRSLIFVYVRKSSKTLVVLFPLKAVRGLN